MLKAPSSNKAVLQGWADALSAGDLDKALSHLSPDFVGHYSAMPQPVVGPAAVKGMYESFIKPGFPDQRITIEREVISGDRIAFQMSWTATHKGPFLNVPATGKRISCAGTGIFRVADGKIVEAWVLEDFLGIYQQITGS
jgi:C-1 hydroxylase